MVSERVLRALQGAPEPSTDEVAVYAVWVPRAELLDRLTDRDAALRAGERVWARCEPWIPSLAELAQDPSVLLAELPDWAALLDRHSRLRTEVVGDDTEIVWTNYPGAEPDARECELRLGALSALLRCCAGDEVVAVEHTVCAALGAPECRYVVEDWIPCRDPRHESVFRETALISGSLVGREDLFRALERLSPRARPFPEVSEVQSVRRFMEEVEDIILVFNRELRVVDANRAAVRFFGMTLTELRGQSGRDLLESASLERLRDAVPELLERGPRRGLQLEARTRRGAATLEVSARAALNGRSIVCIARDVTERLRLERELEERNEQLREQNARIAEADQLKTEFLANVTHELSTPLTCIKGFAKLMRTDELRGRAGELTAERRVEFLQIMESEARRMTGIIKDLLELSNIESGGGRLDRTEVSLNTIVAETLRLLKPRLDESGLNVELDLDPLLTAAWLDADKLKQVALNLLDNAIKFSPPGSRVVIRTEHGDGLVRLRVRNDSHELEEGDLARIFARFVQRDGSFTRRQGGVGLGLDLTRAIVELHGGRIWAELPARAQVEFVAELPIGRPDAASL